MVAILPGVNAAKSDGHLCLFSSASPEMVVFLTAWLIVQTVVIWGTNQELWGEVKNNDGNDSIYDKMFKLSRNLEGGSSYLEFLLFHCEISQRYEYRHIHFRSIDNSWDVVIKPLLWDCIEFWTFKSNSPDGYCIFFFGHWPTYQLIVHIGVKEINVWDETISLVIKTHAVY